MDDYQPVRDARFLKIANENVYNPALILQSAMEAKGLYIKDLAKLTGYDGRTISAWRSGASAIGFSKMNDCLNAMGFRIRFEEIK